MNYPKNVNPLEEEIPAQLGIDKIRLLFLQDQLTIIAQKYMDMPDDHDGRSITNMIVDACAICNNETEMALIGFLIGGFIQSLKDPLAGLIQIVSSNKRKQK